MPKPKSEKYVQIHITISPSDKVKWEAHKKLKFNGLNAMSMMIRDFVNEGIDREKKKAK